MMEYDLFFNHEDHEVHEGKYQPRPGVLRELRGKSNVVEEMKS